MQKINFPSRNEFDQTLRNRIDSYFKDNNIEQTGNYKLYLKAGSILLSVLFFYYMLVFQCDSVFMGFVYTFLLIQSQILLAFNVMHDGGHSSFSSKKWINEIAVKSMELLGSSSMLWKQKHNTLHHTYTNVAGKDDDLDVNGMLRLSPEQALKPWHKYQHFYAPFLYGFLSLYLLFYSDFQRVISNKIGDTPLQQYKKRDLTFFLTSKVLYLAYALAIPMIWHNPLVVIGYFLFGHFIFGLTLSIVFQLAHTVIETDFPVPNDKGQMPYSWIEHQIRTTCNFAPNNGLVTFYCGGLNYQVEHHLFHRISHVHYPKISKIVQKTCEEFNKPYHVSPSFWSALVSHFRFLKQLGQR